MRVIVELCRVVGSDLLNHSARSISNRGRWHEAKSEAVRRIVTIPISNVLSFVARDHASAFSLLPSSKSFRNLA